MKKLSEMNSKDFFDTIHDIMPYVWSFMEDEGISKIAAGRAESLKEKDTKSVGKKFIFDVAMYSIKNKKDDIFGILAQLNDTSIDKISKQNSAKTLTQTFTLVSDLIGNKGLLKDALSFFTSLGESESTMQKDTLQKER